MLVLLTVLWLGMCLASVAPRERPLFTARADSVAINAGRFGSLVASLAPSEMLALQDLYTSTNGPHWQYRTGPHAGKPWNFTSGSNPCTDHWQGITCQLISSSYHIHSIGLNSFNLRGPLPETMSAFVHMVYFSVSLNYVNGTLPSSIATLGGLLDLDVSTNDLAGTIPAFLSRLHSLESLDLSLNAFSGTVPASLRNLTQLQALDLGGNQLHGPLPCWIANFSALADLHLYRNIFSGPLPLCLCNFTKMNILDLSENWLTGPIPSALGSLPRMFSLFLYGNLLTGTIPPSLGALGNLQNLELYANQLSGPLPVSLGSLPVLTVLALHNNSLSGSLPDCWGNLTYLQYFYVNNNRLSGSLPPSLCALRHSVLLDVHANLLFGPLPACLGNLSSLQFLALNSNGFSGPVPSLGNLSNLQELQLQDNHLSGGLGGVFSDRLQALGVVQVQDNRLTGQLPAALFSNPFLTTFVAVSNCLHGRLPDFLCRARQLHVLVLDGVSSAPACRDTLLPGLSQSYSTELTLYGPVPACLLNMSFLTTLHLSGNGLTGPLPEVASISPALVDVTLSHNLLTGTIPGAFQRRRWFTLDLSYNRLSGTLGEDFASEAVNHTVFEAVERALGGGANATLLAQDPVLYLENNRLSGRLPGCLRDQVNISVLGANLFSCRLDRSDLPRHDPNWNSYQCGSDSFSVPFFLWLGLACGCLGCLAVVWGAQRGAGACAGGCSDRLKALGARMQRWDVAVSSQRQTRAYFLQLRALVEVTVSLCGLVVLVLLPVYLGLSSSSSTVTRGHAWQASAAFLSGTVPAGCELALWTGLLAAAVALFCQLLPLRSSATTIGGSIDKHSLRVSYDGLRLPAVYVLFMTINVLVVVGVNAAFVYIAIYRSAALLAAAQVLISLFKLAWNNFGTAAVLHWCLALLSPETADVQPLSLLLGASLLNNIVVPCLAVAAISPDCFYTLLDAAPEVSSQYSFPHCVLDDTFACVTYTSEVATTSYAPPFRYSYQCSASLVTYYAPAYVVLCLVVTFASPVLQVAGVLLHQHATPGSRLRRTVEALLPPLLRENQSALSAQAGAGTVTGTEVGASRVLVILVTFLGLLLTFGAVFPPLAAALALSALSTYAGARAKVGRWLTVVALNSPTSPDSGGLQFKLEAVENECAVLAGDVAVLHRSLWMVVGISSWFYALFLFDTLGDAEGFAGAFWVLVVMPCAPLALYAAHRMMGSVLHLRYPPTITDSAQDTAAVELKAMAGPSPGYGAHTDSVDSAVSALHDKAYS